LERLIKDQALRIRLGRAAHEKVKKYAPENVWNMWEQLICTLVKD
jgi:glycosyltransferase involved in cell wall biosynthesis